MISSVFCMLPAISCCCTRSLTMVVSGLIYANFYISILLLTSAVLTFPRVHSWLIISGAKVMLSRTKRCGKCDNGVESVTERCVNLHKLHTLLTVFVKKIVPLHREDDGYDARTIPETIPISP